MGIRVTIAALIRTILTRALTLFLVIASCNWDRAAEVPPSPQRAATDEAPAYTPIAPARAAITRNQIAAGFRRACVRTTGDRLTCWGDSSDRPTVVADLEHVAGVVAGGIAVCAWTTSGEVFCTWGGRLQRIEGLSDVVELATDPDGRVICARRGSGHVACWSRSAELGPVHDVDQVTGALELAVAGATACIRDAEGVDCWDTSGGKPILHRIPAAAGATRIVGGRHIFIALRGQRPPVGWDSTSKNSVALPALPGDVVQIALGGYDRACALGRAVQCWNLCDIASLHEIPNVDHAREIAIGDYLACAHVKNAVACWGAAGSLGDGMPPFTETPVSVSNLDDATRLSIADERTCARRASGRVVCWGTRLHGESDPAPVEATSKEQVDEAGKPKTPRTWVGDYRRASWTCTKARHVTCVQTYLTNAGFETFPDTSFGNLDGARDLRLPNGSSNFMCVANAAGAVSCFAASDGAAHATVVDGVADVIQLASSDLEMCALERTGAVKCWNEREREIHGEKVRTIANITDAVKVVGGSEVCALERTGTVKCWNKRDGEEVRTIANITDAVEVVGGSHHVCARHRTGKVSCWGERTRLGDNVDVHRNSPIVVVGVTTAP